MSRKTADLNKSVYYYRLKLSLAIINYLNLLELTSEEQDIHMKKIMQPYSKSEDKQQLFATYRKYVNKTKMLRVFK